MRAMTAPAVRYPHDGSIKQALTLFPLVQAICALYARMPMAAVILSHYHRNFIFMPLQRLIATLIINRDHNVFADRQIKLAPFFIRIVACLLLYYISETFEEAINL
jgi:hypothetical protein